MSVSILNQVLSELRARGVPVGTQELLALASALSKGLHESSLEDFYYVARALLIHDESRLDDFDQVFAHVFKGVPYAADKMLDEIREWLANPIGRPELTEEEKAELKELSREELLKLFEERLKEQTEQHDGGNYWIGTGGRSPFGTGGYHPTGISLRSGPPGAPGGGRSLIRSADARRYRPYRHDLTLDVRQLEVALRKLRSFDRQSSPLELNLEKTIDATARNFGELEIVETRARKPNTRVILMMDVGGSMDPYAITVSQLFSAAKRATHWKELKTYYFHNCVYSRVYGTSGLREPTFVKDLLRTCDQRYKLVMVGDAAMASYELLTEGDFYGSGENKTGLEWLITLRKHFPNSIWLNPELGGSWRGGETTALIARVFPMFPLTISGLEEGMRLAAGAR